MDDFSPKEGFSPADAYRPEDEYAPIDAAPAQSTPVQPAPAQPAPLPQAPVQPVQPVQPVPAPPTQQAPAYPQSASYPQAAYPPYPPYSAPYPQPMQPPVQQPMQPPYYPGYGQPAQPRYTRQPAAPYPPQQQYPVYPQQPMQQVRQPMPQPVQPPVQQPTAQTYRQNPYIQQAPYAPAAPPAAPQPSTEPSRKADKPVTPIGTKVFLIILSALLVAMIVGFIVYINALADKEKEQSPVPSFSDSDLSDLYKDIFDDLNGNSPTEDDYTNYQPTEFEQEITLVEDKGETQQRDDDNKDSVGKPDMQAKSVTLQPLPKDKDDAKYSAQSAYENVSDSVVTVELFKDKLSDDEDDIVGLGTGTIISEDGYIVTNSHVVGDSRRYAVKIVLNSGEEYQAKIIGYDTWTDLAVLKIDAKGLQPVVFGDSDLIVIGQDVIAIGSPGGEKFQNSLTKGIVSAVDRELTINKYVRYIQSDAVINPGNSGGPLCNIYGQVIGINTAKTTATYYEAMTFSIPSETVQEIVNELLHYGYVRGRTRIGLTGSEVSQEDQYYYGTPAGIIVSSIDETGSLAGTDIREDDIITAVNGKPIASFQDIYAILREHKPGDKLTLSVYRLEEQKSE